MTEAPKKLKEPNRGNTRYEGVERAQIRPRMLFTMRQRLKAAFPVTIDPKTGLPYENAAALVSDIIELFLRHKPWEIGGFAWPPGKATVTKKDKADLPNDWVSTSYPLNAELVDRINMVAETIGVPLRGEDNRKRTTPVKERNKGRQNRFFLAAISWWFSYIQPALAEQPELMKIPALEDKAAAPASAYPERTEAEQAALDAASVSNYI